MRTYPRCKKIWGSRRESQRKKENHILLCDVINKEPSNYEEATEWKDWKDDKIEEYQSIMKNDVWDVVPRPEGKSVVTSKWIYKIKNVVDGIKLST